MRSSTRALAWALPLAFLLATESRGIAAIYYGRLITGAYVSHEELAQISDGTNQNDFATFSTRLFFKASELTDNGLETTLDLRDKNDFFDQLDQQRLQLTPANTFQVYELSARLVNEHGSFYGTLGRFAMSDAGAVFVDGAEAGNRWSPTWRSGVFGGLDPKREDQTYMTYNPDSLVFGSYFTYQSKAASWLENTYWSNALVDENVQGHTDRLFYYSNLVYQWRAPSQIVALAYFDFVPHPYIQTGLLNWSQKLNDAWSSNVSLFAIDVIEYQRRQSVLETLAPSPYQEASTNFRFTPEPTLNWDWNLSYGIREADHLYRAEASTGPSTSSFFDHHLSAHALFGARRNFTANEAFTRDGIGYFSKDWEVDFNLDYAISTELYANVYHPVITELSLARYFSREFYGTITGQEAQNEQAQIWSGYFKLGLRFGSNDVPPLRDGAAPRGRL